jgi:3',5'-cyclic AMP phosphodiesterase CpdA
VSRPALRALLLAAVAFVVMVGALAWLGYLDGPGRPSPSGGASAAPASPSPGATAVTAPTPASGAIAPTSEPTALGVAVLVGAGDIADCSSDGDEATAALLETLPGTVFTLGDSVYENGTASEFERCYGPSWGRPSIRDRTRPVPGNHDYNTPGAGPYFEYFGAAAGDPAEGWYAYDHGAWRVYVLNSNCAAIGGCEAGSRQQRWLEADLAANPRACVAAMWHHPRFSSSRHGSDALTEDLWRTLYDAGAELVLTGHDHSYERFAPQTPSGGADPDRGLIQFVVGTGGRSHYGFGTVRANSLVRNDDTYGLLRLELAAGSFTYEFIPVAGKTFTDGGSGTCQ